MKKHQRLEMVELVQEIEMYKSNGELKNEHL